MEMEEKMTYMELWQENQELKRRIAQLENKIVEIDGWKGKDDIEIFRVGNVWTVVEHRKEKGTGEVTEAKKTVAHVNVQTIWKLIKELCPVVHDKTRYRELVPKIIEHYNFTDVDVDSFNGGKNRSKYLFPYYYYPLKVLEKHYKVIEYGGSGIIERLK